MRPAASPRADLLERMLLELPIMVCRVIRHYAALCGRVGNNTFWAAVPDVARGPALDVRG